MILKLFRKKKTSRTLLDRIKTFIGYGSIGWGFSDSDNTQIIKVIKCGLVVLQKQLVDKKKSKSIRLCIKLCEKIISNKYSFWYDRHISSWGGPKYKGQIVDDDNKLYEIVDFNFESLSDKNKIKYMEDLRHSIYLDNKQKQRDSTLLFSIMNKYYQSWVLVDKDV